MSDLSTAYSMMDTQYDDKEFISKFAAPALASRVAIYFGEYQLAEQNAALVINSGSYSIIPELILLGVLLPKKMLTQSLN